MMVSIRQCSWLSNMKSSILIKAILLNCFYLLGMLIFFKPFFSIDDFLMSNIAYGVYGEQYDYHVTYMNFAYGRFIVFLLKLFPKIPWYAVLFYIWIFTALTLLTYMIFKWNHALMGKVIVNALLLYFSYEGYIAIQFTKVAGIVAAVALFVVINEEQSSWKQKITAIGLWIISCMIRYDCAKMVLGAWCLVIFAEWAVRIYKKRKNCWKKSAKRGKWILFIIGLYVLVPKLSGLGMSVEEKEFWKLYWKNNDVRVSIQDYAYPGYNENREVYDAIGISENDLYLFSSWNWDCSVMTLQKGNIIKTLQTGDSTKLQSLLEEYQDNKNVKQISDAIERQEEKNDNLDIKKNVKNYIDKIFSLCIKVLSFDNIQGFFKEFPKNFLNIDVCVAYLLMILLIVCVTRVKWQDYIVAVGVSSGILLLLEYYLYINGRYLQHRVDVGITINAIGIFLYLFIKKNVIVLCEDNINAKTIYLLILIIICGRYFYYSDDYQRVSNENLESNSRFFEQTQNSDESYFLVKDRNVGSDIFVSYGVFDVPKIGVYKNIVRTFIMDTLKTGWQFADIIDDKNMFLVISDSDNNETSWKTYFTEHSGKDVQLTLVKKFLNRKIYKVNSMPLKELIEIPDEIFTENLEGKLDCVVQDSQINVIGTAYVSGQSGFSQNAYIQIVDRETGKYELYNTLTTCDKTKKYGDDGYFAQISAKINVPEFYSRHDRAYLIIEQDGKYYKKSLVLKNNK